MDILSYILSKKNSGSNPGGSGGSGGSSSASVEAAGGGTLVDPTKTYSRLYFNIALSNEEVMALMNDLPMNTQGMGNVLYGTSENEMIMAIVVVDAGVYIIMRASMDKPLFAINGNIIDETITFTGWNPDIDLSNGIEISGETVGAEIPGDEGPILIGANNNKITDLFSSMPIRQPINRELSGTYDGSSMSVTNNGTINISELLDQNKLPLEININLTNVMQQRINLVGAQYLFYNEQGTGNTTMSYIDLSGLDTSKVTNMNYMFYGCSVLSNPIILNTDNVIKFRSTFAGCWYIKTIDLSKYNISDSTYSSNMFGECHSLKKLIIRSFGSYAIYNNAFDACYHITGTINRSYNPNGDKDGYIYVPDDMVDTLKADSNWSTYATQIKPLSELPEDEQ